jgi:HSP20 family molecular chaperone IbpA
MSVEISSSQEAQARNLAQKKTELQAEENAVIKARANAERNRMKEGAAQQEKTERALVEISKAGEGQVAAARKQNTDRLHAVNENSKKAYEDLAKVTAEELKSSALHASDILESNRASSTERIKFLSDRSEDPFYRIKTLSPVLREENDAYTVQVALAPHEAENLLVASDGNAVNLSLSRRFQDKVGNAEGATRTNSFQTVVEQIAMPGPFQGKKISREYHDGIVTVRIPKLVTEKFIASGQP